MLSNIDSESPVHLNPWENCADDTKPPLRQKIFRIKQRTDIAFKYYQFFEASTPEEFDSHMNEMANLSLYDTGVRANYGDKLITLSTCDNSEQDGRFVVVAKKIN